MPDVTLKKGGSKIVLKINGIEFSAFNNFHLSLNYNSIASVFSFDGFFDINNPQHKKLFKPLSYNDCTVEIEGEDMAEVLIESDKLVAELDKRYPPNLESK